MPGYFRTLAIPMRGGRDFTERDTEGTQRVALIDEALARRFWPAYPKGDDPIGQHLLIGGTNPQPALIVGIVADVHQNLENSAWPETVYVSFAQNPQPSAMLAIRTDGDPFRFTKLVRDRVRSLDPDQPIAGVQTMNDLVDQQVGRRRLIVWLLGSFAGMALLLSLTGIYGVISFSVIQRLHELGIRWALGAQQVDILRLVMAQGLGLTLAGIAIGIAGALALTRVMNGILFQIGATDPATFAGIALLFILVAVAAGYFPARRATQIDPMAALRI
jgi:predicted permease